jgi:hypothetical protein
VAAPSSGVATCDQKEKERERIQYPRRNMALSVHRVLLLWGGILGRLVACI